MHAQYADGFRRGFRGKVKGGEGGDRRERDGDGRGEREFGRDSRGSRKNGWGGWERNSCHIESRRRASRKGAAFLSNVIETTIKYERTTMNASNNPELFASSISRPENEGALRRLYRSRGVKIWLNYTTGVQAVRRVRQVYVLVRSTILYGQADQLSRELTYTPSWKYAWILSYHYFIKLNLLK